MIKLIHAIIYVLMLDSCTISFSNISTHGTATDLVDQEQTQDVKPQIDLPVIKAATGL